MRIIILILLLCYTGFSQALKAPSVRMVSLKIEEPDLHQVRIFFQAPRVPGSENLVYRVWFTSDPNGIWYPSLQTNIGKTHDINPRGETPREVLIESLLEQFRFEKTFHEKVFGDKKEFVYKVKAKDLGYEYFIRIPYSDFRKEGGHKKLFFKIEISTKDKVEKEYRLLSAIRDSNPEIYSYEFRYYNTKIGTIRDDTVMSGGSIRSEEDLIRFIKANFEND